MDHGRAYWARKSTIIIRLSRECENARDNGYGNGNEFIYDENERNGNGKSHSRTPLA